jgi:hypothetical protein
MNPFKFLRERDIDLLLVEEFYCSEYFRNWFIENTIGTRLYPSQFCGVWHSVMQNETGESDLEVDFLDADGKRWRVLIENKVNAEFQPKQALRYKERGEAYKNNEGDNLFRPACDEFYTVVIAPEKYIDKRLECQIFNHSLAYEKLYNWFGNASDMGERGILKQKMIEAAIEQQSLGYQPQFNEVATQNWQLYYHWVQEIAPELGMRSPIQSKTSGTFICVKPPKVFPKGLVIIHKTENGSVDLQFPKKAETDGEWEAFQEKFSSFLNSRMTIVKAGKSAAIRLPTLDIDITKDFGEQKGFVLKGILAAKELLYWAREHHHQLHT